MSKIIAAVVGGSGFLGSHVADELSDRGYSVRVIDRGLSPWIRQGQQMLVGDIQDRQFIVPALQDANFVFHFAGISDIKESIESPYRTLESNIMGTVNCLEASVEANAERFVYASTMYVYSEQGSFYRASKQAAEIVVEAFNEQFGLEYSLLRYGSLYGPRAQIWNGLRGYVEQIVSEGKINYSGTGEERREYIHVKDAARMTVDILEDHHANQAITLTGTQVLSSKELLEMIFEIAGVAPDIKMTKGSREGFHYVRTPYRYSPKKAKKIVPTHFKDIGEGILELVEEVHRQQDERRDQ